VEEFIFSVGGDIKLREKSSVRTALENFPKQDIYLPSHQNAFTVLPMESTSSFQVYKPQQVLQPNNQPVVQSTEKALSKVVSNKANF